MFRQIIQRIVDSTPGAMACAIMGFDGIAIDSYEVTGELDVPTLLIEYSAAAGQLRNATETKETAGNIAELVINADKLTAVMRPLNDEYFLATVLRPNAVTGKARYLMRVSAAKIVKELTV